MIEVSGYLVGSLAFNLLVETVFSFHLGPTPQIKFTFCRGAIAAKRIRAYPEALEVFRALKRPGFETPKHLRGV